MQVITEQFLQPKKNNTRQDESISLVKISCEPSYSSKEQLIVDNIVDVTKVTHDLLGLSASGAILLNYHNI